MESAMYKKFEQEQIGKYYTQKPIKKVQAKPLFKT
jgi:hypothetical protein